MKTFLRRLGWLVARRRKEDELREELEFHLTAEADERRAAGLADDQARYAARRDLGNVTLVMEDTRASWGWPTAEQFLQDVRYAARTAARTPTVTITVILTLALGIGLTTAMFSVVRGILLRPLPYDEPDRLVMLHTRLVTGEIENAVSPPNFMSLREEQSTAFAHLGSVVEMSVTLTGVGEARRVNGGRVSAAFFDAMGVRAALGRTFDAQENNLGRTRVAVISHALWQQQFGGDPRVVGRQIDLQAIAHTVIGVLPQGFDFPEVSAVWIPLEYGRNYFSADSIEGRKNNAFVRVVARLGPTATLASARAELDVVSRRLADRFPQTNTGVTFLPVFLHDEMVADVTAPLLMLFGAVACVLLIATANVAGLFLARGASRREEIAMRGALGAGRGRIVRQLVTESLLLGAVGGVLGFLLSIWVTGAITAAQAEGLRRFGVSDAIRVDAMVLAFALAITLVAGVVAGLAPALRAADEGLAASLHEAGRRSAGNRRGHRVRRALVVAELALAVVLLHGAGLLLNSFARLMAVDPGFRSEGALTFRVDLPQSTYGSAERVVSFYRALLDAVRQQPGVISVGAISRLPIGMPGSFSSRFELEGRPWDEAEPPAISARIVSPDYFHTVGMTIRRGRGIMEQDAAGRPAVIVINEAGARRFFPDEDPIGRRMVRFSYDPLEDAADAYTVVGIVSDVRSRTLGEAPEPQAYFSHAQVALAQMSIVVRADGEPLAPAGGIRRAIAALDGNIPMPAVTTLDEVLWNSLDRPRFFTTLLSVFSAVALLLGAVGIFGLVSFAAARRTREFGVRIALGAVPSALLTSIVGDALALVGVGLVLGLGGALALTRTLEGLLFAVRPGDPMTFAAVTLTLALTAVIASVFPAWRAAGVDPLIALRAE
jgi:putative ABC transport system permease protein